MIIIECAAWYFFRPCCCTGDSIRRPKHHREGSIFYFLRGYFHWHSGCMSQSEGWGVGRCECWLGLYFGGYGLTLGGCLWIVDEDILVSDIPLRKSLIWLGQNGTMGGIMPWQHKVWGEVMGHPAAYAGSLTVSNQRDEVVSKRSWAQSRLVNTLLVRCLPSWIPSARYWNHVGGCSLIIPWPRFMYADLK